MQDGQIHHVKNEPKQLPPGRALVICRVIKITDYAATSYVICRVIKITDYTYVIKITYKESLDLAALEKRTYLAWPWAGPA